MITSKKSSRMLNQNRIYRKCLLSLKTTYEEVKSDIKTAEKTQSDPFLIKSKTKSMQRSVL